MNIQTLPNAVCSGPPILLLHEPYPFLQSRQGRAAQQLLFCYLHAVIRFQKESANRFWKRGEGFPFLWIYCLHYTPSKEVYFGKLLTFFLPIRVREGSPEECSRDSEGWFQATRSQSSQRLSSGLEDTALLWPSRARDHQDHRMMLRRPSHARDHTS